MLTSFFPDPDQAPDSRCAACLLRGLGVPVPGALATDLTMKLACTRIITRDVAALTRFYRAVTGLAPVGSDDYVEFENAGAVLAICSQQAMDLFGASAAVAASNRSMIIDFEVNDVDEERGRIEPFIGTFVQEPTDQPWGTRSMLFRDPDGNLIQFYAPIAEDSVGPGCEERRRTADRAEGGTRDADH